MRVAKACPNFIAEQAKLDAGGALREEREVDSALVECRPKGTAFPHERRAGRFELRERVRTARMQPLYRMSRPLDRSDKWWWTPHGRASLATVAGMLSRFGCDRRAAGNFAPGSAPVVILTRLSFGPRRKSESSC